jgi:GAF domain-containing protein/anti-sigma regulatory factor (Ser/Thr protein kinase)
VVTVGSAEEALERYPLMASFGEGYPMGAQAAAPLLAGDELLGVLGVNFRAPRRFSLEDESLLLAIGRQCGQAIERARLFEAEQRALRRAARLQEVTARLARAVTTEDAARAILRGATGGVGADAASIALASDDGRSLRVSPGLLSSGTLRLRPPFEISTKDRSVLAHVYRDGRAMWIASPDEWESRFEEGFATQADLGRCVYAVPIVAKGEAIGALAVYFQQERSRPSAEEADLISSFAHQAGVALERARAYEVEHEAAMTLQRNLMPEGTGYSATVDVDGRYLPATRGVHVGGDWYDIVDRPDGTVAFAVGDIAGHGLQAAAAMGQVRSAWRALALSMTEPNAILTSLDRFVGGVDGAFFSTILTLLLDPSRGELRYASAGHPPALVIEPDGSTRFLEGGRSVPLGLPFDLPRPQAQERLGPGSILVVYTDGLVERREEPLDRGLERLAEMASRVRAGSLTEISDGLLEIVAEDRHDDVALLTIGPRRPVEVFRRTFPADAHELATMRAELRAWLERSGLPAETREDVVLACTEAATNAIEHAYIGRRGDVLIEAESEDGALQVKVIDHGRWRHPRPDDSRGRGLELVRAVIGDIDVERGEGGTTVRMRVGIR